MAKVEIVEVEIMSGSFVFNGSTFNEGERTKIPREVLEAYDPSRIRQYLPPVEDLPVAEDNAPE